MNRITKILAVAVIIGWSMHCATAQEQRKSLEQLRAEWQQLEAEIDRTLATPSTSGSSPASPASSSSSTSSASSTPASSSSSTANASPAARTTASSSAQKPTKEETLKWLETQLAVYRYGGAGARVSEGILFVAGIRFPIEDFYMISKCSDKTGKNDCYYLDRTVTAYRGDILTRTRAYRFLNSDVSDEMIDRFTNALKRLQEIAKEENSLF